AKVVGILNASTLTLPADTIGSLPSIIQKLVDPSLTGATAGATAPILDLVIASSDGVTPPVDVNLLGLNVTTSNIDARLFAKTGDGQVLGNLLYNIANLANPGGAAGLLNLLNQLGAGNETATGNTSGSAAGDGTTEAQRLLQLQ